MPEQPQAPQLNLERLVDLVRIFPHSDTYSDTLVSTLADFPPKKIKGLDGAELENALEEVETRSDVIQLQTNLEFDLSGGIGVISPFAFYLANKYLGIKKIKGKGLDARTNMYDDWVATCSNEACKKTMANGMFDTRAPFSGFIPEQMVYAQNLEGKFYEERGQGGISKLKLKCEGCGNREFVYQQAGVTIVFRYKIQTKRNRDIADQREKQQRIKEIAEGVVGRVAERVVNINSSRRFKDVKKDIIDGLYKMYRSVRKNEEPNGQVQYGKLYKMFELIKRKNVSLLQFQWVDQLTRDILEDEINRSEYIRLPYAVIKMRVKSLESIFRKALRVSYDLKMFEGEHLSLRDLYGLRVILPTEQECEKVLGYIQSDKDIEILEKPKNFFIEHKPNGYKAIHIHLKWKGVIYSLQMRTHESDKDAETKSEQLHDDAHVKETIRLIKENVPYQVRMLYGSIFGVKQSPLFHD